MKSKAKVNLNCLSFLEGKQWFNIAVNRAYYYVFQNFLLYMDINQLNDEFETFKEKSKLTGKYKGSHEITFDFICLKIKDNIDKSTMIGLQTEFMALKKARHKADYDLTFKYDSKNYPYERKNFDKLIIKLQKINIIGV